MFKKVFNFKKISLYLAIIMITYLAAAVYLSPVNNSVGAVAYRWGSRGTIVTEIQRKLKAWGYYNGSLDGVYGYGTYLSVRSYQRKNGLNADGIAGDQTLNSLGINAGQWNTGGKPSPVKGTTTAAKVDNSNSKNVTLLARCINGEARGEPYEGQVAVGAVIVNRTRDSRFPSTIAGVIYQPGAFTAIVDGQIHSQMYPSSIRAARDALNGWDPSGGAVFYYNPAKTTNAWIWSRPIIKVIGKHKFCK